MPPPIKAETCSHSPRACPTRISKRSAVRKYVERNRQRARHKAADAMRLFLGETREENELVKAVRLFIHRVKQVRAWRACAHGVGVRFARAYA